MSSSSAVARIRVRVWDPLVRLFHWTLVAGVGTAFLTEDWRSLHRLVGYGVLAAVGVRVLWGVIGSPHARFTDFVRGPREVLAYVLALREGREPRYLGHNPLGGAMVIALLVTLTTIGVSGWLLGLDVFWGDERIETLHATAAHFLLFVLVPLHLAGVVWTSWRERVNLVQAMITGIKEIPAEEKEARGIVGEPMGRPSERKAKGAVLPRGRRRSGNDGMAASALALRTESGAPAREGRHPSQRGPG